MNDDKENDISTSINARNTDTTVTTIKTEMNAFRICSFIGKITFESSTLE